MQVNTKHKENFVISVVWVLIFASAPLYMYYALVSINETFEWQEVLDMWGYMLMFLLLFLLHHYLLVPRFFVAKQHVRYTLCVLAMLALFTTVLVYRAPEYLPERIDRQRPMPRSEEPMLRPEAPMPPRPYQPQEAPLLPPPDMARLVIAILMLSADLGVLGWMQQQKMRQRLMLLEQQNLKQELEHLRYQINPHFLMNTLNNIHVLVDVDQERAKRTIVELSTLMRYALYEGNCSMAPLDREREFLRLYLSLMKLRYSNKLEVVCQLDEPFPADTMIPPMLLATFVENAFKHGVSYQQHSYIRLQLSYNEAEQQIVFKCQNSRHTSAAATDDGHHGIGLENVRKRLDLQYGNSYQLIIDDSHQNEYAVSLVLPACVK